MKIQGKFSGLTFFEKFSETFALESDKQFIKKFENVGGFGISKNNWKYIWIIKVLEIMN